MNPLSNDTDKSSDAYEIGTDTAWLNVDRLGNDFGRVYVITFVASDGRGGEATGKALVFIPNDYSSCVNVYRAFCQHFLKNKVQGRPSFMLAIYLLDMLR